MLPEVTESPARTERRPVSVAIALIALWFIGMNVAGEGFATMELVRDPFWSVSLMDSSMGAVRWRAYMEATRAHANVLLPIGVAELLLGGLLVFLSVRALISRRLTPSLFLQIVAANAALAVLAYVLREPVRGAIIDALVRSGLEERPSGISPAQFSDLLRTKLWWSLRAALGLQLVTLTVSAWAVVRRSSPQPATTLGTPDPS